MVYGFVFTFTNLFFSESLAVCLYSILLLRTFWIFYFYFYFCLPRVPLLLGCISCAFKWVENLWLSARWYEMYIIPYSCKWSFIMGRWRDGSSVLSACCPHRGLGFLSVCTLGGHIYLWVQYWAIQCSLRASMSSAYIWEAYRQP